MTENELREFIDKQSWIFAKTYANKAPHEYVVRGRINGTDEEFMNVVNYIKNNGVKIKSFSETTFKQSDHVI